jgi:oligoribonuclease (3'-5' exoribonuclease)
MLSKMWNPELTSGSPVKKYEHRALEDIKESIQELVYYKEQLWKIPASKHDVEEGRLTAEVKGLKLE